MPKTSPATTTPAATPPALGKTVAVIGGGIAGITAAAKLYRQGYAVTLFEQSDKLGGNLSTNSPDNKGKPRDIYPHIFGDWYKEFWYLLEIDFGLSREQLFEKRDRIKMAIIPADTKTLKGFRDVVYDELGTPSNLRNLIDNLYSDIMSKRDMFMFGYTYLELASHPQGGNSLKTSKELDVNGYLYSRPYMNDNVAEFHDDILKIIWSMPSDQTSAEDYKNLLRYTITFPDETPFAWLLKGPIDQVLMSKISGSLAKSLMTSDPPGAVRTGAEVKAISITEGSGPIELTFDLKSPAGKYEAGEERRDRFDYVVIATQAENAARLVISGNNANNIASKSPGLARLREARTGRIPVVYLYFTPKFLEEQRKLGGLSLPPELIGFKKAPGAVEPTAGDAIKFASDNYDISILDISQLWHRGMLEKPGKGLEKLTEGEPVLVLAASHATAIAVRGPEEDKDLSGKAQGFAMIEKLCEYFPFIKPGAGWGAKSPHIDWERTHVITNETHQLFLNDASSESWRPCAKVAGLDRIFFAGDYCKTDIDMATVEAAVQSGVLAARALQIQDGQPDPIPPQPHGIYASSSLLAAKLLAAPAAFAVAASESYQKAADSPVDALMFPYTLAVMASAYGSDWLRNAEAFWRGFLPGAETSPSGAPAMEDVADYDHRIGLAESAVKLALALMIEGPGLASRLREPATEALYSAWYLTVGKTLFPGVRKTLRDPARKAAPKAAPSSNTWSGLLKQALGTSKVTPKEITDAAFGLAATVASGIQIARKDPDATREAVRAAIAKPELTIGEALSAARKAGAEARREKSRDFRVYPAKRSLEPVI